MLEDPWLELVKSSWSIWFWLQLLQLQTRERRCRAPGYFWGTVLEIPLELGPQKRKSFFSHSKNYLQSANNLLIAANFSELLHRRHELETMNHETCLLTPACLHVIKPNGTEWDLYMYMKLYKHEYIYIYIQVNPGQAGWWKFPIIRSVLLLDPKNKFCL